MALANFSPPGTPVKPTSVRALERVTTAPFLLALVLGTLLVVTCAYLLATSVRARRRDLAVLRGLGSDSRQLRAIVPWQATLMALMVVVVAIPLGILAGRWVVSLLTNALGIVPGADVPLVFVLMVAVAAFVLANVLALLPARKAAHTNVVGLMRDR